MNKDLEEIVKELKGIESNSVILYIVPKNGIQEGMIYKSLNPNHVKSLTHDLLNLFLQEQFQRKFNFVATLNAFKAAIQAYRPSLSKIKSDLNSCQALFNDFNHTEQYTEFKNNFSVQKTQKQLEQLNEKLAALRQRRVIADYLLYSNLDNQTIYCQDTDSDSSILAEILANTCEELQLNPNSLVEAMINKAQTLRAQMIMGTYNSETQQKSVLLKLSQFGYYDFYRSYSEMKIQNTMIRVSKFVQNNGSDWHCIFVESPMTNYLSISYTDFAQVKEGLLNICRGDNIDKHIERNANWLKLAFSSINLNKWFYPSKKWNASGRPINQFSQVEGLSPLPVDEFVRDNHAQVNGILSEVIKDNMTSVKSAFNKRLKEDYPEPLASVIFQLLGTLTSVYPEHQQEIKDFGRIMEKKLL